MELIVKKSAVLVPVKVKEPKKRIKVKVEPTPTPLTPAVPVKAEVVVTPKKEKAKDKAPKQVVVENIKHVVEAPKVVTTVDLTRFQKPAKKEGPQIGKPIVREVREVKPAEPKPKHKNTNHILWRNFPIEDYNAILVLVKAACQKLGRDVVTISKVAKINYVVNPNFGSIWYSCGNAPFREHFRRQYEMMYIGIEFGIRRITKAEAIALPMGSQITMGYIMDDLSNVNAPDIIDNTKIEGKNNEGIWYKGVNDPTSLEYFISFDSINEDGSFNDGVDGETVYLYVDVEPTETAE